MTFKLAIVGRPNVGKSTLFNRLAGKKLAIVDDRPGVTRDRREADGRLGDLEFTLIDTAGFEDVRDASLESRMREQTEKAIQIADVCLFLIDAREGVTILDERFAGMLRKSGKPLILAANKCEGKAGDTGINESFGLGLGEPLAISGEHGDGMADLYQVLKNLIPEPFEDDEPEEGAPLRLAIVGRPNAGKSTLANALLGEDRLIVGPEAGVTRDAVASDWEFGGRRVRLVDTAGMRKKAKIDDALEKMSVGDTLRAIRLAEVVLLVMDETGAFEEQDLQIADLIEREGRACVFVVAKWDLVTEPQARLAVLKERFERLLPQVRGAPLVALSAETGRNMDKLMPAVLEAHRQWNARIKTHDLNTWLQAAIQRHPPPVIAGRRLKPKYISQIKSRPPTFVLMCARAEKLPESYKRYLLNSIRETFEVHGTPMRLMVRGGENPYDTKKD
jgi:GTP-binding protein